MTLRIIDSLEGMRQIRSAYDEVAASCHAAPFVSWEWLYRWWENAGTGYDVQVLTLWSGDRLDGVLPLMRVKYGMRRLGLRELRFASDCVLASPAYLDLVARPGSERDCLDAALTHICEDDAWDRIELSRMRARSNAFGALCQAAAQHELRLEVRRNTWCRQIPLPATFDDYLAGLSSNRRGQIRNFRNRLAKAYDVRFVECASLSQLHSMLDRYFTDKSDRMDMKGKWTQFRDPSYRQFMRKLAEDLWEKQWLRLWGLEVDEELAAVSYGIVANGTYHLKNYSYGERYTKNRLGHVLLGYCIEQCIDREHLSVFDFLSTEYPYKAHYAKARELMVKLTMYRPRENFFLHDKTTGSRLYYSKYGWYHMDVSSPSFQDFWSQEALTWITTYYNVSTSGLDPAGPHFDGLFADDCWIDIAYAQNTERMTRVKDDQFGRIPQAKVNSFHNDMLDHIEHMKQALGSRILIVNSGGGVSQDYAEAADGVMHEQWMHAAWWSASTDPRESNWLANISSMQTLSAKGKYYLAQDNLNYSGLPAGRDEQVFKFAFASYLLATDSVYPDQTKTSLRHRPYLDTSKTAYYTGYWYGIYDLDPGTPLGPYYVYYQDKTKGITVYARDYTNAIALVNPSSENNFTSSALDATVSLPGQFNEIRPDGTLGPVVSSITVKNKSGAVVARTTPVGAPIVSLQQTIDKPAAPPGDIVTYTFVYQNVGSVSARSFAITDVLPAQVAFVGGSAKLNGVVVTPDPISTDGTVVQMPIGEVAAGQQGTFTFQVQVK